jgi:hypothetical protein
MLACSWLGQDEECLQICGLEDLQIEDREGGGRRRYYKS